MTESDFPADEAMISLSLQLEPHDGQFWPTPIGFEPKKAWLPLVPQNVQVTQILLYITLAYMKKLMYLAHQFSLFIKMVAD